jgi:hypothetical protein
MAKWEYKCIPLDRRGTKEDFSFSWTYGPWEVAIDQGGKKPLTVGLDELGRQGWELAGVLPSDLWSEGTRTPNTSHGVRTISCTLVFKRPADEQTTRSSAPSASAATSTAAPATQASPAPPASTPTTPTPTNSTETPAPATREGPAPGAPATATPATPNAPSPATKAPSDSPA